MSMSLPGLDRWLTTDPRDTGLEDHDEECELVVPVECEDCAEDVVCLHKPKVAEECRCEERAEAREEDEREAHEEWLAECQADMEREPDYEPEPYFDEE